MDARYTIETPEQIDLSYNVAGIGSRFLAAIVDTFMLGLLQILLLFSLYLVGSQIERLNTSDFSTDNIMLTIWGVVSFIMFWGYYLLFEMLWNGQSPGKRIFGLRVVREGGRPITFGSSAIRNLVRVVDFLPGFYGIGLIVMFIDQRSRRLGDFTAGSMVVKETHATTLATLTNSISPVPPVFQAGTPPSAALTLPNLEQITSQDYDVTQDFLRRRSDLRLERRVILGTQLATKLAGRMGYSLSSDPERFLELLVYEYRVFRGLS